MVIGWREKISLPDWKISGLVAKVDTGAKSSALDVLSVEELSEDRVRFTLALSRKGKGRERVIEAPIVRKTRIRSSTGKVQSRILVATRVELGSVTKLVEFSLARRKKMICRALLGRIALQGDFLIDPSVTYISQP